MFPKNLFGDEIDGHFMVLGLCLNHHLSSLIFLLKIAYFLSIINQVLIIIVSIILYTLMMQEVEFLQRQQQKTRYQMIYGLALIRASKRNRVIKQIWRNREQRQFIKLETNSCHTCVINLSSSWCPAVDDRRTQWCTAVTFPALCYVGHTALCYTPARDWWTHQM